MGRSWSVLDFLHLGSSLSLRSLDVVGSSWAGGRTSKSWLPSGSSRGSDVEIVAAIEIVAGAEFSQFGEVYGNTRTPSIFEHCEHYSLPDRIVLRL